MDARGVELGEALQRRVLPLVHQLHGVGVVERDVRAHRVAGVVLARVWELLEHPLGRLLGVDDDRHLEAAPADLALHVVLHLEAVLALRRLLVLPLERHKQEVDALVLQRGGGGSRGGGRGGSGSSISIKSGWRLFV